MLGVASKSLYIRHRKNDELGSTPVGDTTFSLLSHFGWFGDPIFSKKYQLKTVSLGCTFLFRKLVRDKIKELSNMWTYCKDCLLDAKASALKNFLMILWSDFLSNWLSPGSGWDNNHCCVTFWQKLIKFTIDFKSKWSRLNKVSFQWK